MGLNDIEIAHKAKLKDIRQISEDLGVDNKYLEPYGNYKAKIKLDALKNDNPKSNLILVSALTPTSAGEGKTTVSIGLAQALQKIDKKVSVALREPSLGPVMGMKGGAAGGGYSQVLPMEDINLHFTGDLHAITSAHNLVSAVLDNALHRRKLDVDQRRIVWPRVLDMNDRALRGIIIGLGGPYSSVPRESHFEITAASEIMATLCLANSYRDLKRRVKNIVVGYDYKRNPVTVEELNISGSVVALLKDALKPNLVQSIEGVPAIIHGGPFANIAHGTNSLIGTKMAMNYSDYVVTEAGFGFDLGGEKFLNLVSRYGNIEPSALVLVATVRALKRHGGVSKDDIDEPNPYAVAKGLVNLEKHVENAEKFGFKPIIALNKFNSDTQKEINAAKKCCLSNKYSIVETDVWQDGGDGGIELAEEVVKSIDNNENNLEYLYDLNMKVEEKIEIIAKEVYGARSVDYSKSAKSSLRKIYKHGFDKFAICMAKTQYSLSDNPKLKGKPEDFDLQINDIIVNAGPEFLVPISGSILRMPGLPKKPAAELIDIDENGEISGLF
ncbi:MAG: formate--tetrahydrofolate ligase [Candidatus Mcinerneyibacterium aminivorans]|uniref:Formate--tetrahydrofolate ligase n=1 Tax=Candidatus Mcinerneyibacterium aminivorans TaxID=2703815 RepID=A0A5D0MEW7_9BACT|nr:MAG: formate--tetrahydrofolate ligase [Candidatus Mcinerneyibacterium aminivorans]